jgi:hypothetical protein
VSHEIDNGLVDQWRSQPVAGLTGRGDGPALLPPLAFLREIEILAARSGSPVSGAALLGQRTSHFGMARHGDVSCGRGTRLLPCADGWIAVTLARESDIELIPAWLENGEPGLDVWSFVEETVRDRKGPVLVERAGWLGLPVGMLGEASLGRRGLQRTCVTPTSEPWPDRLVVVELASLWAGPLCGWLLGQQGHDVIKVESRRRPDGSRRGAPEFFRELNGEKDSVLLDFASELGRSRLHELVDRADVVVEGSRPRALIQLGIDADAWLRARSPRVWISITAHGRTEPGAMRVGFGDDAAVAGALVAWDDRGPLFFADAVADPLSGMTAAAGVRTALGNPGSWMIDVSMAAVAADLAAHDTARHPWQAIP